MGCRSNNFVPAKFRQFEAKKRLVLHAVRKAYFAVNAMMCQHGANVLEYYHQSTRAAVLRWRGAWESCRSSTFASAKFRQIEAKKHLVLHGVGQAYFAVNAMMRQHGANVLGYGHQMTRSAVLSWRGAWESCRSSNFASAKFRQIEANKRLVLHGVGEAYLAVDAMMRQYGANVLGYCHQSTRAAVLSWRGAWESCHSSDFASAKFRQFEAKKRMVLHGLGEAYFIVNAMMSQYRTKFLGYCHQVMRLNDVPGPPWSVGSNNVAVPCKSSEELSSHAEAE